MKRLVVALAAMGLTASVSAYAASPASVQAMAVTMPEQSGFFLGLTGLYDQPSLSGSNLRCADVVTAHNREIRKISAPSA